MRPIIGVICRVSRGKIHRISVKSQRISSSYILQGAMIRIESGKRIYNQFNTFTQIDIQIQTKRSIIIINIHLKLVCLQHTLIPVMINGSIILNHFRPTPDIDSHMMVYREILEQDIIPIICRINEIRIFLTSCSGNSFGRVFRSSIRIPA